MALFATAEANWCELGWLRSSMIGPPPFPRGRGGWRVGNPSMIGTNPLVTLNDHWIEAMGNSSVCQGSVGGLVRRYRICVSLVSLGQPLINVVHHFFIRIEVAIIVHVGNLVLIVGIVSVSVMFVSFVVIIGTVEVEGWGNIPFWEGCNVSW